MNRKYPNIKIVSFEIYKAKDKLKLLNQYSDIYRIPSKERGIPVIFLANQYLLRDDTILIFGYFRFIFCIYGSTLAQCLQH